MAREHDVVVLPRHKDVAVWLILPHARERRGTSVPTPPFPPAQRGDIVGQRIILEGRGEKHAAEYPLQGFLVQHIL